MKKQMKFFSRSRLAVLAGVGCSFCLVLCAAGQTPSAPPEPPTGPLLKPLPSFARYTITFSYADERAQASASGGASSGAAATPPAYLGSRIKSIETARTDDIFFEELVIASGLKVDEWHVGATEYRKSSETPIWMQENGDNIRDTSYTPIPASGYRDLDFITAANYLGTVPYGTKTALVFASGASLDLKSSDLVNQIGTLAPAGKVAFIDAESRAPLEVLIDGVIRLYQFGDQPTEKLSLPADLAQQIRAGQEGRDRLLAAPPRPY